VRESTAAYMATVLDDAHMRDWLSAAAAERWIIKESEIGEKKNQTNWRPS